MGISRKQDREKRGAQAAGAANIQGQQGSGVQGVAATAEDDAPKSASIPYILMENLAVRRRGCAPCRRLGVAACGRGISDCLPASRRTSPWVCSMVGFETGSGPGEGVDDGHEQEAVELELHRLHDVVADACATADPVLTLCEPSNPKCRHRRLHGVRGARRPGASCAPP